MVRGEGQRSPPLPRTALPWAAGSEALHVYQDAAHAAAVAGAEAPYLEALRAYMRAGRDVALRARKGAA